MPWPELRPLRRRIATLAIPRSQVVRAGKRGGLPFDTLTSDLTLGCLSATQICYGNCFAAKAAFEAGMDFGTRVPNSIDEAVLREDLAALPSAQGYLRNGWNSDPSWTWEPALHLAQVIHQSGLHPVFITKCFTIPSDGVLEGLARVGAEFRVSLSAFDTRAQLEHRLRVIHAYREHGGIAVPNVMTARFTDPVLNRKQDRIIEHCASLDLPTAENSLRIDARSPVMALIDRAACGRVAVSGDFWSGRLYLDLRVPTVTSVPPGYRGLQSPFLSKNDPTFLQSLWHDPVRTHPEVMSMTPLDKPRQCGVAMSLGLTSARPMCRWIS